MGTLNIVVKIGIQKGRDPLLLMLKLNVQNYEHGELNI